LAGASRWEELRYSLRSLEKHFKEDFLVYLVGDCPDWLKVSCRMPVGNDFTISEFENLPIEPHEKKINSVAHLPYTHDAKLTALGNTNRMLELFLSESCELPAGEEDNLPICQFDNLPIEAQIQDSPPDGRAGRFKIQDSRRDLFVRMWDDVYFIGDRTLDDLMVTRIIRPANEVKTMVSGSDVWRRQVLSTAYELQELGYPGYMTESHCPEVFSILNMRLIYEMFELPGQNLLTSTLYYNIFPYERELIDKKTERALFYGAENEFGFSSVQVAQKCSGKYFLNHNDVGLNEEVIAFLMQEFPDKSRFEN